MANIFGDVIGLALVILGGVVAVIADMFFGSIIALAGVGLVYLRAERAEEELSRRTRREGE